MKHYKTLTLVRIALFAAIIVALSLTPLGFIPLVGIKATTIHIPVILGSLFLGPWAGAFLGFMFGLMSFIVNTTAPTLLSFAFSPVFAYGIDGAAGVLKSLVICFVPRILVGIVPYFVNVLLFKVLKRLRARGRAGRISVDTITYAVSGFIGSMTNTILVMGGIYLLFRDAYASAKGVAVEAVFGLIMGTVSFQGVIEAAVAAVLVTGVSLALMHVTPLYCNRGNRLESGS